MGISFLDGVAVAADTLRHDYFSQEAKGHGHKFHVVNQKVVVVKAGYGPDADILWEIVSSEQNIDVADPMTVTSLLREKGQVIYDQCRNKAETMGAVDPGLYLIVVGISALGIPSIHWLNFGLNNFVSWSGQINCVACASRTETNDEAAKTLNSIAEHEVGGKIFVSLDVWARMVTIEERKYAEHAIGFPIELIIIRKESCLLYQISENEPLPAPTARVRIA